MNIKRFFIVFALFSFFLVAPCEAAAERVDMSVWIADWALPEGLKEAELCRGNLSSVQIFAAYFDESDRPFLGKALRGWLPKAGRWAAKAGGPELYLTVVNDLILSRNRTIHKDPDLISRLLNDETRRKAHLGQLIALAATDSLAGLELDYERVKPQDWENYLAFCTELKDALSMMGKKLRVVLEPKKEYYTVPLPEGIEYVIMAYNLHGGHNEPGPKADRAFIGLLAQRCRQASGTMPRIAFATGGFLWGSSGKVTGLTERDAQALARKQKQTPLRDLETGALSYTTNARGPKKIDEVWFADGNTLAGWRTVAEAEGFKSFALWRLGGNNAQSLKSVTASLSYEDNYRTLYVAHGSGGGSGSSADRPLNSLSRALSLARAGDRIIVAPGTYEESLSISTPNLRIEARDTKPGGEPTVVLTSASAAVLTNRSNTLWRGVKFAAAENTKNVLHLENFSGRFEYCHFVGHERGTSAQKLIEASNSRGAFHGCVFKGLKDSRPSIGLVSPRVQKMTFSHCLFTDLGEVCCVFEAQRVSFINCLFVRNRCLLTVNPDCTESPAFINSIFFLNGEGDLFDSDENLPKIEMTRCVYTPTLNRWGNTFFQNMKLENWPFIKASGCLTASPEFVSGRHKTTLNLGIDDSQNLELWCAIADEASTLGLPVTLAVNTARMTPKLWQDLKLRVERGHEAASHSSSHAPVDIVDAIQIAYYRSGIKSAFLTVNQDKLTITADGKPVFEFSTAGSGIHPTLGELREVLRTSGIDAELANPAVRDIPCRVLQAQRDTDIFFSNIRITLPLDRARFVDFEMRESLAELEHELGQKIDAFVFPYSTVSEAAKKKVLELGFKAARTGGEAVCSPFTSGFSSHEIWAYALGRALDNPDPPRESMRNIALMLMDFFKDRGVTGALYSHRADEMSLDAWKTLLSVVSEDKNVRALTLSAMADLMAKRALDVGVKPDAKDVIHLPADPDQTDYHLRPSSRLRGAGVSAGIAEDFEGTALKAGDKISIGLYQ